MLPSSRNKTAILSSSLTSLLMAFINLPQKSRLRTIPLLHQQSPRNSRRLSRKTILFPVRNPFIPRSGKQNRPTTIHLQRSMGPSGVLPILINLLPILPAITGTPTLLKIGLPIRAILLEITMGEIPPIQTTILDDSLPMGSRLFILPPAAGRSLRFRSPHEKLDAAKRYIFLL